jgi:hypothetical protein
MESGGTLWERARGSLRGALRRPELYWALAAWLVLAAFELLPAASRWDVVTRQPTQVSLQHMACSQALGAWVGLAWLSSRQRMARAPSLAPAYRQVLPPLVIAIVGFTSLSAALPWFARALAHGGHAHHEAGLLEPLAWCTALALCAWTLSAALLWTRALPQRAVWGGAVLGALAWLVSPDASAATISLAAVLACASAVLWPTERSSRQP